MNLQELFEVGTIIILSRLEIRKLRTTEKESENLNHTSCCNICSSSHYAVKLKPTVLYVNYISVRLGKYPIDADGFVKSSVSRGGQNKTKRENI